MCFEVWAEMSIPISRITWIAFGCTYSAGLDPALCTATSSPAAARRMPSARWLRQEFPVQRMRTLGFINQRRGAGAAATGDFAVK
jgi:hypothetical protein